MAKSRENRAVLKPLPLLIGVTALVLSGLASAASEIIGRVKTVQGEVTISSAESSRTAEPGSVIRRNETIVTGADASVGITFRDDSRTSLGPNSELHLAEYRFEPAKNEYAFVSRMLRGTMLFVSGLISKLSPESAKVETPTATLGIRGTRFLLRVEDE